MYTWPVGQPMCFALQGLRRSSVALTDLIEDFNMAWQDLNYSQINSLRWR